MKFKGFYGKPMKILVKHDPNQNHDHLLICDKNGVQLLYAHISMDFISLWGEQKALGENNNVYIALCNRDEKKNDKTTP